MKNKKLRAALLLIILSLFFPRTAQADFLKPGHVSLQGEILGSPCLINLAESTQGWESENVASDTLNNSRQSLSLAIDLNGCNTPLLSHHHADIGFEILQDDVIAAQDRQLNYPNMSIRDASGNEMVSEKGYQPVRHSFDTRALKYTFHFRGDSRLAGDDIYRPAVRFRVDYN
ncbi:hypothetical protein KWI07_04995 [Enterobacter bugandensis]|uniref:hypothetical protein n=1 Tax=Enterobacter bugandensis TaxID=881260 RepID=UPI0021D13216|nr:hypothetical protein [Enterobacter bugandensis]MCU6159778.1 hypothetical protein [Enterobacter bugandensis]